MKNFLEATRVSTSWSPEEGMQLLRYFLTVGRRWRLFNKRWEVRTQEQLKNRWYSIVRHRLHGHIANPHQLIHVLGQSRRGLAVPELFLLESDVTEELNGKGRITRKAKLHPLSEKFVVQRSIHAHSIQCDGKVTKARWSVSTFLLQLI
jgi:hypothetical protein